MGLTAIIVDDEQRSRSALRGELADYCPDVKLLAEANSVATGVIAIQQHNPDLIFLDIQMGDGSGFDVLRQLGSVSAQVIFVTAFDQYAVEAFRFSAVDYLLKPVDGELLSAAVHRVRTRHRADDVRLSLEALLENQSRPKMRKLVLHTTDGAHIYRLDEVVRIESDGNYCKVFLIGGKPLLVAKTLKEMEETLSASGFERPHQSHLVNMDYVRRYVNKDGGYLIMADDTTTIPVAQRKKAQVLAALDAL